jgi:uncharacterized membrane protein
MWLVFGVLGVVIGGAVGSFGGGFAGAVLGALAGLLLRSIVESQVAQRAAQSETRIEHIYKALGDIHFRLKALEDAGAAPKAEVDALKVAAGEAEAAVAATRAPAPAPVLQAGAAPPVPTVPLRAEPASPAAPAAVPVDAASLSLPPLGPAPVSAVASREAPLTLEPLAAAPQPAVSSAVSPTASSAASPVAVQAAASVSSGQVAAEMQASVATAVRRIAVEEPPEPAAPGFFARLFAGNLVAKAGVVILFFGVGFLLKYAYDHAILPPWTRLLGVAIASAGLFYAGRRLLESRRLYALILMGGGFGFLYLDVFFALKWYHYIDAPAGFALFMALGVATVLTAVRMDARALAVLGLFGAFLAPPLASTGSGNHVLLFSYYTLLNLFILGVSWFKAWRDLNLVGFGFTFVISAAWGVRSYRPELFGSVEPFLIAFFLIYLAIPVLFATRQKPELKGLVDGTLVFGTPAAAAFMQARLVAGMGDHALAWSAGIAAVIYAVLGTVMRRREHMQLLGETYVALATVLGTMTIFFALDAYPTFALWTLEGAAIVWVGLRQRHVLARTFGLLLQFGAALYFLAHYLQIERANPVFNDFVFGCALIALAAWLTAWLMDRYRERISGNEEMAGIVMLAWGFGWWFGGGLHALYHALPSGDFAPAMLLFATATLLTAELAGAWLPPAGWPALRRIAALQLVFIVAAMLWAAQRVGHPLSGLGVLAWPLGFAVHFWILRRHRNDGIEDGLEMRDLLGWLAAAGLATWDAVWLIRHGEYALALLWAFAGFAAGWLRYTLRERDAGGNADQGGEVKPVSRAVLLWALIIWGCAGASWLDALYSGATLIYLALACTASSVLLFELAGSLGRWPDLRQATVLLPVGMAVTAAALYEKHLHPLAEEGAWAWPLAFAVAWAALWRQERDDCAPLGRAQHLPLFWLFALLLVWEVDAQLHLLEVALQWQRAAWGVIPALLVALVLPLSRREVWPFRDHASLYRDIGLAPLLVVMAIWSLYANFTAPGPSVPALHLPLLNPLDLTQMLILYAAWAWARGAADERSDKNAANEMIPPVFGALAFIWVNGVALRAIHYYADVPYEIGAQLASVLTQSVLSLLWTSCALVLMTWASRRGTRTPWTVGAVLLGVVVLKLVVNDLGNSGTVARIVSFLGVGAMLLLIGYIAPLPPGQAMKEADGTG